MIDKNRKNRADLYISKSQIQKNIAKKLISKLRSKPTKIVDLGCGTGYVYEAIKWDVESFIAVDRDIELLQRHPKKSGIECLCEDFEKIELPKNYTYFSSSSLQWSSNLESLLDSIQRCSDKLAVALFTSNSFVNFHKQIGSLSPLYDKDMIEKLFVERFPDIKIEFETLEVEFEDARMLVDFLRYSGMFKKQKAINYNLAKKISNSKIKNDSIEILYAYNI